MQFGMNHFFQSQNLQHTTARSCVLVVAAAVFACFPGSVFGQLQLTGSPQVSATRLASAGQFYERSGISGQVAAQHSPNIETVLKPEFKLVVERRHSQLVLTRSNVRRLAVTDSTVCNYVQYSPSELAIVGLELGTTDLMIWFEGHAAPAIYEVTVVRDENLEEQRRAHFSRLERRLSELFPNSNVYLVPVGSQVLVKGQAYDPEEADQILQVVRSEVFRSLNQFGGNGGNSGNASNLYNNGGQGQNQFQSGGIQFQDSIVNMLEVPGEYNIKMRVVIAEISRSQLRDMGIDWNTLFNNGRHSIGASLGGASGATLSGIFENGEINVLLKWLATNGTATLLAEPTIVCMSGHSASLLAGGEFAVPTIIGLGGGQNTSFRGVGTSMVVTPTVIDHDLVRMQIVPEFSAIDGNSSVNGIPGTTVKRVQTTVELREGQTLAIGGLISRQMSTQISRIPLLGDIPFIGSRLFHSKNSSEDEVELLVLVTPEIVRAMEPDEVPPLPNFYVTHPNDDDLYKYGRSEGNPDTNVYQVQPFGTGQNRGIASGYSLESANMLPQYADAGYAHAGYPGGQVQMLPPMQPAVSGVQGQGVQRQPSMLIPQPDPNIPPPSQMQGGTFKTINPQPMPPASESPSYGTTLQQGGDIYLPQQSLPSLPNGYQVPGSYQGANVTPSRKSDDQRAASRFRSPFHRSSTRVQPAGYSVPERR